MVVSTVAVQGRALVMAVSRWPASVAAEVLLVSKLARSRVLCAKKFALLGLMVGVSAKEFACVRNMAHNRRFVACWASFFAKELLKAPRWAKFFAGEPVKTPCRASFVVRRGGWHALQLHVGSARRR